jgi:hypothetical protein
MTTPDMNRDAGRRQTRRRKTPADDKLVISTMRPGKGVAAVAIKRSWIRSELGDTDSVLSLFKRKRPPELELTFKSRVERFWVWFSAEAPRLYAAASTGKSPTLAAEVSAKIDELGPGFAWVFGRGDVAGTESFTLSGEGVLHKQLLAQFWLSQAPRLPQWVFYSARQPGSFEGVCMDIGDRKFDPMEFWLTPAVDTEAEKIDLVIWHPLFAELGERERWTPVFLFLDEVLGEFGTQQWIGEIKLHDRRLNDAIPLKELLAFVKGVAVEKGWKKHDPGEEVVLFRMTEPHDRFPRADILTCATACPDLLKDFVEAEGRLDDPLAGTGAHYVYVAFATDFLPKGQEASARGVIEDALDEALRSLASGRLIGGAFGRRFSYIDLLIFDGAFSIQTITDVLKEHQLPVGSSIEYFAQERRGHRIVV